MAGDRILVVDDEESVAVTMQAILEMDGYDVMTALNGAEAGELIRGAASSTWCSRTSGSRTRTGSRSSRRSAGVAPTRSRSFSRIRIARLGGERAA